MHEMSAMQSIELTTADGARVAARTFAPAQSAKATVLIAAAMGVKQDYYADFAAWLARQGYAAMTFDYRGTGASRPKRRCTSSATAWARNCPAGARLKKVGDLPRGVILQWRRWCLNPRYHVGHEGESLRRQFAAASFPIVALSITDDELMTERGTRVLIDCYENAPRELQRIAPSDVDAKRVGHFGFFRAQFEATLWTRVTHLFKRFSTGAVT